MESYFTKKASPKKRGGMNVLCEVLMRTDVECVAPEDSVERAAQRLEQSSIGFLPVCDRLGKVLGVLTERDIAIGIVSADVPPATRVREIMTHQVVACIAQDEIAQAEELMLSHQQTCLMCLDEAGRIEGVISLSDIAEMNGACSLKAHGVRNAK